MSVMQAIREAGLVGMGGAGFPTHVKLAGGIEHLIVNAMECEPLLFTDRYVMRTRAAELVHALAALKAELGVQKATFALKKTYTACAAALRAAIAQAGAPLEVFMGESYYPAGDEQAVVYAVTGRIVPPLNIPISVGCAVINIGTLYAVHEAIEGRPLTKRILTVAGEVNRPTVLEVPIGTPFSACIAAAGGATGADCWLVSGGPMMGKPYPMTALDTLFVGKTTSGILLLPKHKYRPASVDMRTIRRRAGAACIQCSYCTELCPRYLLGHPLEPHRIMRKLAYEKPENLLNDPVIQSAALCCECGVCEVYACPMGLQPRSVNAYLKKELAAAGIRHPKAEESPQARPMQQMRLIPAKRAAARAGVLAYYGGEYMELRSIAPPSVTLALAQGIGAPAQPIVAVGERVEAGQRIAQCPEGKLGAELHASITGLVTAVEQSITINEEVRP